jgi:hypothetical protein
MKEYFSNKLELYFSIGYIIKISSFTFVQSLQKLEVKIVKLAIDF